ncbi:Nuclear transport factor 2 [Dissophora globulifera]|uniref:Nuclear transport factor 2 n=1 Tax=Dissophora globulifera TaxID=979702 RepID=A0A9P6RST4_9FUNG|nr:Nuclear transport factor 2 [Dissophora globulifera]
MAEATAIAQQFTEYYYSTFDTNRSGLQPLYRETSVLTWEGAAIQGGKAIVDKLVSLPFTSVQHRVSTQDAQPVGDMLVIAVTGQLLIDGEQNPQFFTQTFVLRRDDAGFYVQNDFFRLVYG